MIALALSLLVSAIADPAPPAAVPALEHALRELDDEAFAVREAAQMRLSLAPRVQLVGLWDRARRGALSPSQRARLRDAIAAAPRRGGAISLAASELGAAVFPAPDPEREREFRAWIAAFPVGGGLEQRRAASACWDGCGEEALYFLERLPAPEPELARWSEAASRRLRIKLLGLIE